MRGRDEGDILPRLHWSLSICCLILTIDRLALGLVLSRVVIAGAYTRICRGLQRGLHRGLHRGLQGSTGVYTRVYRELQGSTEVCTGIYRGLQRNRQRFLHSRYNARPYDGGEQ